MRLPAQLPAAASMEAAVYQNPEHKLPAVYQPGTTTIQIQQMRDVYFHSAPALMKRTPTDVIGWKNDILLAESERIIIGYDQPQRNTRMAPMY